MKREEAIYYLKSSGMSDEQIKTVIDAFTCEDCISREEAINVVHKYFVDFLKLNDDICLDGIRSLPSVTPSIPEVEDNFDIGYNCGYADAMCDIGGEE